MKSPKIIYEDKNIAILEKPQGMPSQKSQTDTLDLLSWANANLKSSSDIKLLNRLDQPVGGLVILGKTGEAIKKLSKDIQNKRIKKDYLAVVHGKPQNDIEIFKDYISKRKDSNFSEVTDKNCNSKLAELSLKKLSFRDDLSLINIRLKTGRHHQIRVQTSYHGIPLWGDTKYSPEQNEDILKENNNWLNIALWSYKLIIQHPISRKEMTFYSHPTNAYPWNLFEEEIYSLIK